MKRVSGEKKTEIQYYLMYPIFKDARGSTWADVVVGKVAEISRVLFFTILISDKQIMYCTVTEKDLRSDLTFPSIFCSDVPLPHTAC